MPAIIPLNFRSMSNPTDLKIAKWPFFLGDAVLLALAYFIYARGSQVMNGWDVVLFVFCGTVGAAFVVTPYIWEYYAAVKMVEAGALSASIGQLQNIESVATQIAGATAQWQTIQEHSTGTTKVAKDIADRMTNEVAGFKEFLLKANDGEKNSLRLEIEKLRRAESDCLQIIVRMLDHTYALHQAATRSGQAGLIEQLTQFQGACRDVARRIGLVPFAPNPDEPFDPQRHQSADAQAMSVANAKIRDTVATGYTYQGQLIRPALVALHQPNANPAEIIDPTNTVPDGITEVGQESLL
jgi:molecular chaperone GrpE (heat shock protein)